MNKTFLVSGFWFLVVGALYGQDARQIVAESQKRGLSKSQRYEGTLEVIGASNKISLKRWMFERIGSYGSSKAILRFTAPAEVKGVALKGFRYRSRMVFVTVDSKGCITPVHVIE